MGEEGKGDNAKERTRKKREWKQHVIYILDGTVSW